MHRKPKIFQNEKVYQNLYDTIFYPAISQFLQDKTQKIYNLEFYTQGVSGIIRKWIDLGCETEIPELISIIKSCIGYTLL